MPAWGVTAAWWAFGLGLLYFVGKLAARWLRKMLLMRRFGDAEMVQTILEGRIAQGMSPEMVVAAWGKPTDLDEMVMKTKTKAEMKYDQEDKNRFGTRVYIENGSVVGWETK